MVLDQVEERFGPQAAERRPSGGIGSSPRVSTGVPLLDEVLGGLKTEVATVISCERGVVSEALACAVAVASSAPIIVAAARTEGLTRAMLSVVSQVPYAFIESGFLLDDDWTRLAGARDWADDSEVLVTDTASASHLVGLAVAEGVEMTVVLGTERFAPDAAAGVDQLRAAATSARQTLLVITEAPDVDADGLLVAKPGASDSAVLMAPDEVDGLRSRTARTDLHRRTLW